ncbi:unnamed protein product [Linum tenue]|uniref:Uncharacterized protein n=1 Tax=Linum tenue TaxID=586396 RepID=A0AAV0IJC0_9ROSI|nr:unnamed protein product [Linum tenue]
MRFHQAAAAVWNEPGGGGGGATPPPKLSLFSLPAGVKGARQYSPAGPPPPTPPINRLASVPFKWEEAPGKPRPPRRRLDHRHDDAAAGVDDQTEPIAARCLELPPRLVVSGSTRRDRVSNMPSPAACRSFRQEEEAPPKRSMSFTSGRAGFGSGSGRWGNLVTKMTSSSTMRNKKGQQVANFDSAEIISSSSYVEEEDGDQRNVKISRIRRRRSLFNLSAAGRPQACLNSIYRSFKKMVMVPARRS